MEERCSVNSPRRILSFSRNRRADVSFPDVDDRSSTGFGVSVKPNFIAAYTLFDESRYWALAVPTFFSVTVVLAIGFYIGVNFMATPPPTSLNSMFDEFSREPLSGIPSKDDDDDQPIEPISDIDITQINEIMFNNKNDPCRG
ncbi:UNVERIFIED_CONTAM: Phosphatidylinositol N-acetylglucosaminyltransferase subunit P [Sesamum calycinum]|uniref:Phosphatidylinositol N-acetylglucosaminyltransferase subunit P n=1 Tax=Sesamum calycinum TaxID=2727403 RepID=A0AAW2SZ15_9LAMI